MDDYDFEAMREGAALKRLGAYSPKKHKRSSGKIKKEKELDILKLLGITHANTLSKKLPL